MSIKVAYAGDRKISVEVLKYIMNKGVKPLALMVHDKKTASHNKELIKLCDYLNKDRISYGRDFTKDAFLSLLKELKLDYIICVHFKHLISPNILEIPKEGVLNLHPAYLPFNRGWHTPTWAILDKTPYGATLHFMNKGIDSGEIVHQKKLKILPNDTANTLYARVLKLELEVFEEAWPYLVNKNYKRKYNKIEEGTVHEKKDLKSVQKINLHNKINTLKLMDRLRALTTNDIKEAAYFELNGKKYRVQINIQEENEQ